MAAGHRLRLRRSAAELHALVQVEREIRATDSYSRRKYLREFSESYRKYERVLSDREFHAQLLAADVVLVGDYHALPKSQQFAAELVETLATITGKPVVLGLETVFSQDQQTLDTWLRGEIAELDLRENLRFDQEWGYDWTPFYAMLSVAKRHARAIVGLDCSPRGDLRRIGLRDRHAAERISKVKGEHPDAIIVALFGESHLAPSHLPLLVKSALPKERVLTVLQNIDPLYWKAAGERERVRAVQVGPGVLCVFTSTPLEKYESYRLCIERWRQTGSGGVDLAPAFANLVEALARCLGGTGEELEYPSVCSASSLETMEAAVNPKLTADRFRRDLLRRLGEKGIAYVPELNTVFALTFQLPDAAEEASRCLRAAWSGTVGEAVTESASADDYFYRAVLEEALIHFGSRVLYPAKKPIHDSDLYHAYARSREEIENAGRSYADYMEMIDFIVLHRDYESNLRQYWYRPELLQTGLSFTGEKFTFVTHTLGQLLGTGLYEAYVAGRVTKRSIRSLFCRRFNEPGVARTAYFVTARRIRGGKVARRRLAA